MINVCEVRLGETIQVSFFMYIITLLLEKYTDSKEHNTMQLVYVDCLCITDELCCSAEAVSFFFFSNFHNDNKNIN